MTDKEVVKLIKTKDEKQALIDAIPQELLNDDDITMTLEGQMEFSDHGKEVLENAYQAEVLARMLADYSDAVKEQIASFALQDDGELRAGIDRNAYSSDLVSIRIKPASTAKRFNQKRFGADHPDLLEEYKDESPTRASVTTSFRR